MNWNMDRARMFCNSPTNGLTNPPGCIGTKTEATLWIKLLCRTNKPQVAFLYEVKQRNAMVAVPLGNTYNKAQICLDKPLLSIHIALGHFQRNIHFLLSSK